MYFMYDMILYFFPCPLQFTAELGKRCFLKKELIVPFLPFLHTDSKRLTQLYEPYISHTCHIIKSSQLLTNYVILPSFLEWQKTQAISSQAKKQIGLHDEWCHSQSNTSHFTQITTFSLQGSDTKGKQI